MAEKTEPGTNLASGIPLPTTMPSKPSTAGQQVTVDDSHANTHYANFARVTGTPEELIIDLGLNMEPYGAPTRPLQVEQRIVLGYYTAKRLMAALQLSVQRHESAFGAIELDVQRRLQPRVRTA